MRVTERPVSPNNAEMQAIAPVRNKEPGDEIDERAKRRRKEEKSEPASEGDYRRAAEEKVEPRHSCRGRGNQ